MALSAVWTGSCHADEAVFRAVVELHPAGNNRETPYYLLVRMIGGIF